MPFCSSCGRKVEPADKHCNSCGEATVNSMGANLGKESRFKAKYVCLLAGIVLAILLSRIQGFGPFFYVPLLYGVPGGLIGFAVGAVIDQLVGSHSRDSSKVAPEAREERKCPHCAEPILKEARVCKHCGRDVETLTDQAS